MRHLPWIIAVLIAAAIIVIAYPVVQTQRQLWAVQSELNRANEQVVQAELASSDLERQSLF
jgi:cell division protein FtsL